VLTKRFMLGRVFATGLRWLLGQPQEMVDLNVISVQPVVEFAPVYIEND
jgi:hypothetical protein